MKNRSWIVRRYAVARLHQATFSPLRLVALVTLAAWTARAEVPAADPLDAYNVTWPTHSEMSLGSMPLGNGDIGVNVWTETGGDLVFYISKTDAWSGDQELLKVGRIRVAISPNPFLRNKANLPRPFRQTLKLRQGEIEITAGNPGEQVLLRLWVDANHPVIRLEASGERKFDLRVTADVWRDGQIVLPGNEPLIWYQRNQSSIWTNTLQQQGLAKLITPAADPLLYRTFGGAVTGKNLRRDGTNALRSVQPAKQHAVSIIVLTAMAPEPRTWVEAIQQQAAALEQLDIEAARAAHRAWWDAFWNRSWIRASSSDPAKRDMIFNMSRGYTLQRFMVACAGRGAYPIKFNGSIFTFDCLSIFNWTEPYHADDRAWGGCYWFQNTRLIYWPMLAAGDLDLMRPLFDMYRRALPLANERTQVYFKHAGAFFPETLTFWGTYGLGECNNAGTTNPVGYVSNPFIRRYYQGGLELATMMLDWYAYTGDKAFATDTLLPLAGAVVTFYDKHYLRDASGKLHFDPAQSLESYHTAINPAPDIAGLMFVLPRLLALPQDLTTAEQRAGWSRLQQELPPLPKREDKGKAFLIPAESYSSANNSENPELYAVFPYRLYGAGKPDLELGRETFVRRAVQSGGCWRQDEIQAALLGLSAATPSYAPLLGGTHGTRFPAFWPGMNDWIPDQDHGGAASMGLQATLLQADDGKIQLCPAWPKEWDVDFKLHAPQNTTVECVYRGGKIEKLIVTPESRAKDVVNHFEKN